jgi:hypothetical protein
MLIPIAVEMVLVAFRVGLYVNTMAENIESMGEIAQSWTYVIPEIDEARAGEILTKFHESNVRYCCLCLLNDR